MNFKYFLGNEKIKEQLSFLLSSSHFPHAIILEGEDGLGKRTLARELAAYLVCRSEGEKPCYECAQCIKAQKGVHPDIFEHSAAGGARSFHVEVIRDVIKDVYMSPNEAEYKIYILGNAHCMSESAQNALLKVLEEPPAYAVFILTAASKSMLLETVLSRAVTISLSGVDAKLGAELITQNNPDIDFLYLNGNHDKEGSYSVCGYNNLKMFSKDDFTSYTYGNVVISGIETDENNCESFYSKLELDKSKLNIVMLHGDVSNSRGKDLVKISDLRDKGIDYLALGHIHSHKDGRIDDRGVWAFPGCLLHKWVSTHR